MDCIFHCSEEGDTAVPGLMENFAESHGNLRHGNLKLSQFLDIIKDMGKEEITSVQYRHKCHSIFTLKKMLKAIKTFSI